ncbi:hypothetical protein CL176_05820 [Suicoccus acidiformans]|uniref:Uncharacterized protein n=1 Tax=Suicoccus acidiformans TaxID=2036206 RepID=A0A347WKE2_9LACT|nr:hypothetical protein [Suicoccus acidiformans]AXY25549.1 hypothetical protein CL176_05820 [Suicoccus acidiformans]
MSQTVYTNYWINKRDNVRKEHGSYKTEEEALKGIETWWELHKEHYKDVQHVRTNSGALEILYDDDNYVYRIEEREIEGELPSRSYQKLSPGEIEAKRKQLGLDDETYLFDELAEPYRDRLLVTMADGKKVKEWVYNVKGQPVVKVSEYGKV